MAFRFLDLPIDLRLQVYSLALGGQTFHFHSGSLLQPTEYLNPTHGYLSPCLASSSDNRRYRDQVSKIPLWELEHFAARHDNQCFGPPRPQAAYVGEMFPDNALPLQLLLVCRQVFSEASAVPLKENTFTFSSPTMLYDFVEQLTAYQAAALHSITLYQTNSQRHWTKLFAQSSHSQRLSAMSTLTGLQVMKVYIELCTADFMLTGSFGRETGRVSTAVGQDEMVAGMLSLLSGLPQRPTNMQVAIVDHVDAGDGSNFTVPTKNELQNWVGRIRHTIMLPDK